MDWKLSYIEDNMLGITNFEEIYIFFFCHNTATQVTHSNILLG